MNSNGMTQNFLPFGLNAIEAESAQDKVVESFGSNLVKKSAIQRRQEAEEMRKRKDEEETAKVYEDFVQEFGEGRELQGTRRFERKRVSVTTNQTSAPETKKQKKLTTASFFAEESDEDEEEVRLREAEQLAREQRNRNIDTFLTEIKQKDDGSAGPHVINDLKIRPLHETMKEEDLESEFSRYGHVTDVKIVKEQDVYTGYVHFVTHTAAFTALQDLNGESLRGVPVEVSWGKSTTFVDNSDIHVQVPSDTKLLDRITQTALEIAKEGWECEARMLEQHRRDHDYAFLYQRDTAVGQFYRWKLFSLVHGDTVDEWRTDPFSMFIDGPVWHPPPMLRRKLEIDQRTRNKFMEILDRLTQERDSVKDAMVFCLDHAIFARDIIDAILESFGQVVSHHVIVARLFLLSDLLYNSSALAPFVSSYRACIESATTPIFKLLSDVHRSIEGRLSAQKMMEQVCGVVRVWRGWSLFTDAYLDGLLFLFKSGKERIEEEEEDIDGEPMD